MAESAFDKLPARTILLKQIDNKDSIPGGFNTCNVNFKELSNVLGNVILALKEIHGVVNVEALISNAIAQLRTNKLAIPLNYAQLVSAEPLKFEHDNSVYEIDRRDDTLYVITRVAINSDTEPWDTSKLIAQLKTSDGIVANAVIITKDNAVMVNFTDQPAEDHLLLLM